MNCIVRDLSVMSLGGDGGATLTFWRGSGGSLVLRCFSGSLGGGEAGGANGAYGWFIAWWFVGAERGFRRWDGAVDGWDIVAGRPDAEDAGEVAR